MKSSNSPAVSERTAATEISEAPARVSPYGAACAWCGGTFTPRATGGHAQRFCRPACRRACDTAGRRWIGEALAGGTLTIAALRSGYAATRALATDAVSSAPVSGLRNPPL
jgi:hypothetical protein